MSLLLDALKRAGEEQEATRPTGLRVESDAPRGPRVGTSPDTTARDHDPAPAQAGTAGIAAQPASTRRAMWLAGSGVLFLLLAGGGFWLWYTFSFPTQRAPPIVIPPSRPAPVPGTSTATPNAVTPPATPSAPPAASTATNPATSPAAKPAPAAPVAQTALSTGRSRAAPPRGQPPTRPSQTVAVHPDLAAGYAALIAGRLEEAERGYRAALVADPFSLDAELGLASIAAARRQGAAAQAHYRRALEIDPKNSIALAGLANVSDGITENQLRAAAASQPESAAPWATLGALYAGQARWSDAQQAWFEAQRIDPSDPDTAYNLAVSLDHLGKAALARQFYDKALALAATRRAAFDPAAVNARLRDLAPQ